MSVTAFEIPVNPQEVAWVHRRVADFRFFEEPEGHNWEHGANRAYMERLQVHWLNRHDWPATVARLNAFPHVRAEVEPGFRLHALHLRSSRADARPLMIAHGWPGSIVEFHKVIEPLTDPTAYGGDAADAFHLVLPSLPGYGFSAEPTELGWDAARTGRA